MNKFVNDLLGQLFTLLGMFIAWLVLRRISQDGSRLGDPSLISHLDH
jgi:hypothetical protein